MVNENAWGCARDHYSECFTVSVLRPFHPFTMSLSATIYLEDSEIIMEMRTLSSQRVVGSECLCRDVHNAIE